MSALLVAVSIAVAPLPAGCDVAYTRNQARPVIHAIYRSAAPLTLPRRRIARAHVRCLRRPVSRRLMARYRHRWSRWRRTHYWLLEFERLPAGDQAWAEATSHCETRQWWPDKRAQARANIGNGYWGAFQFTPGTWYAAGGKQPAYLTSWHEQAVRAVRWMHAEGASHWPVCG